MRRLSFVALSVVTVLAAAEPLSAAQVHSEPEGLVAHQVGHVIFIVSMGILIYWLRERRLTEHRGWRRLQYSALFFILWNSDALLAHYLESRPGLFTLLDPGTWRARISVGSGGEFHLAVYYLTKFDHLLCVPAIVLLYLSLQDLLREGPVAVDPEHDR